MGRSNPRGFSSSNAMTLSTTRFSLIPSRNEILDLCSNVLTGCHVRQDDSRGSGLDIGLDFAPDLLNRRRSDEWQAFEETISDQGSGSVKSRFLPCLAHCFHLRAKAHTA